MPKKIKKGNLNRSINWVFMVTAIVIILAGFFIIKKPSITGFAVITKEDVYSDILNLAVNESKNITWNLRNPGNLQSIKATGSFSRNGSAKVFIEKGSDRLLVFDSEQVLFDINIQVLPDYKKIFQGEELLIQIALLNLRGFGDVNVDVTYSIKDSNGNLIATEMEPVNVETQTKFVRKLLIPSDLKPGNYVAFVEVGTDNQLIGTSSDLFQVASKYEGDYELRLKEYVPALAAMFLILVAIIFVMSLIRKMKRKKRVKEIKEKVPAEKVQKLEKGIKAMEAAHHSKLISEETYMKSRKRIENKLRKLKR